MEQKKVIPTTIQIQEKWEQLSHLYSKFIAPNFRPLATCLANVIQAESGDYIVETGCGEGILSVELALGKPSDSKLVCIDLTHNMCRYTSKKLSILQGLVQSQGSGLLGWRHKVWAGLQTGKIEEFEFDSSLEFKDLNVRVCQGNNEDIKKLVEDGVADRYVANLSL